MGNHGKILVDIIDKDSGFEFSLYKIFEKFSKQFINESNMLMISVYDAEVILHFKNHFPAYLIKTINYNVNKIKENGD